MNVSYQYCMFLLYPPIESAPWLNAYLIGLFSTIILFVFTVIYEQIAVKRGERWYNKLKEWNTVTTHNPEGEYGNTQHKLISKIVSRNTNQKNLYYFGKYYNKQTIVNYKDEFSQINNNLINKKIKLLGTYKKDDYLQTEFSHIYNYEEWIKYKEWSK